MKTGYDHASVTELRELLAYYQDSDNARQAAETGARLRADQYDDDLSRIRSSDQTTFGLIRRADLVYAIRHAHFRVDDDWLAIHTGAPEAAHLTARYQAFALRVISRTLACREAAEDRLLQNV